MWVTDRVYLVSGIRVQIRSTTEALAARAERLLGRFALPGADPAASDLCFNLVGGKEPTRKGQRGFHFLYKEISRIARTASVAALMNTFEDALVATLARFDMGRPTLQAGIVTHGPDAVLLIGADAASTRRLVASFCARGYTYASDTLLFVDPDAATWTQLPLPLRAAGAAEAEAYARWGLSVPAATGDEDYPVYLDLPGTAGDTPRPYTAIRAVIVESAAPEGTEPALAPFSKARAVLRLLEHVAGFDNRATERPALLRDLLASATVYELRRPEDNAPAGDALAIDTVNQLLGG